MDGVLVYLSSAGGKPLVDPLTTNYHCFAAVDISGNTRGPQDVVIDDFNCDGHPDFATSYPQGEIVRLQVFAYSCSTKVTTPKATCYTAPVTVTALASSFTEITTIGPLRLLFLLLH
jgi:hypothetical protein